MSLVRAVGLGVGLVLVVAARADDPKADKLDPAKLVGAWKVADGSKAGEKPSPDAGKGAVTVTKDKITLKGDDGMVFAFTYTVDAKASPANIDLEMVEPEGLKGTKAKGIVKLEDGAVTICYHPMGGDRPAKFEATKDNGFYLFKLKKADDKDDKKADK